jgi:hypothetical protein
MKSRKTIATGHLCRTSLAIVLFGLTGTGMLAQSNNSGAIFGQVSGQTDNAVVIENQDTGLTRTLPRDSTGCYRVSSLSTGRYKVTLQN